MNRRQVLVTVVRVFAVVALAGFAIPFLGVFVSNEETGSGSNRLFIDIGALQTGQPRFVDVAANRALIVLRPDSQQQRDLAQLSGHVWAETDRADASVYVFWALSTGKFGGCRLQHKPAADSRGAADPGAGWRGGYWAPGCDASYDYAGRPIRTLRHAYGNYVGESRRLRSPPFELLEDGRLAVAVDFP